MPRRTRVVSEDIAYYDRKSAQRAETAAADDMNRAHGVTIECRRAQPMRVAFDTAVQMLPQLEAVRYVRFVLSGKADLQACERLLEERLADTQ